MPVSCEEALGLCAQLRWQLSPLHKRRHVNSSSDKWPQPAHSTFHSDEHCEHVTAVQAGGIQKAALHRLLFPLQLMVTNCDKYWADIYGPLQCRLSTIYSLPAQLNVLSLYCGINNAKHWGEGRPSQDRNKHAFEICCKPISHCIWSHLYVL